MLGLDAVMWLPIGAVLLWLVRWERHDVRWYVERDVTHVMIRRRIRDGHAPMEVWAAIVSSAAATPYPRQAEYPVQLDYDLWVGIPVPAGEAGNPIVCRA